MSSGKMLVLLSLPPAMERLSCREALSFPEVGVVGQPQAHRA